MKSTLRGIYMAAFFINLFMMLMVYEAAGAGTVPGHLPWLITGSATLCLWGWYQNRGDDDDDE